MLFCICYKFLKYELLTFPYKNNNNQLLIFPVIEKSYNQRKHNKNVFQGLILDKNFLNYVYLIIILTLLRKTYLS